VNPLPGFCVNDGDGDAVNKLQRHKSRFIVLETIILIGICGSLEDSWGICEIQTVIPQIPLPLLFVPREPHAQLYIQNVYASRLIRVAGGA